MYCLISFKTGNFFPLAAPMNLLRSLKDRAKTKAKGSYQGILKDLI